MTDFLTDWGLILITFVPLLGALVMMAIPKEAEETHKLVAPLFETEALGPIEVKGKAEPVSVFRVLAPRATRVARSPTAPKKGAHPMSPRYQRATARSASCRT